MLIFQRYIAWKQFLLASTILALALAFVAEPLAVYIRTIPTDSLEIYIFISNIYSDSNFEQIFANKVFSVQERSLKAVTPDEAEPKDAAEQRAK